MRSLKSTLVVVLSVCLAVLGAPGCGRGPTAQSGAQPTEQRPGGPITMIGSTTVLPVADRWRAEYNQEHPEVKIAVSGGGSGTGIKALIGGSTDIAMASRDMRPKEIEQARRAGVEPEEHVVAYDGIAVIAHPSNPVEQLSLQQLSDIFSGAVTEWRSVGVAELGRMQVVSRDSASGTYEAFKELVVTLGGKLEGRDYAAAALKQSSNQAVLALVSRTETGIGYVGMGYLDDSVKAVAVAVEEQGEAVMPTVENVTAERYPIARALYCYTNGQPSGALGDFLAWVKGLEGQEIVEEMGFVPIVTR